MTRFEMNLNGMYGEFWKQDAEREIKKMQERIANDEIGVTENGAAYWTSNKHYLPKECCEILKHTGFEFDADLTNEYRVSDLNLMRKRQARHELDWEARMEMRNAFGKGTKVVNVFTGEVYIA